MRNFLATLFLSQGIPMLLAGDEIGRTQRGNNNAYCQDNELSWLAWPPTETGRQPHRLHAAPHPAQARATRCSTGARSSRAAASRARR